MWNDWCGEVLDSCCARLHYRARICAEQMVWSRTRPLFAQKHLAASFPSRTPPSLLLFFVGVFIRVIQSKWFWLVYAKGELSSLAVHKGISLRKSEKGKEMRRRWVFVGSQLAEWVVVVLAKKLMHPLTHTTLILTYVTHTVWHLCCSYIYCTFNVCHIRDRTGRICSRLMHPVWLGWHTVKLT